MLLAWLAKRGATQTFFELFFGDFWESKKGYLLECGLRGCADLEDSIEDEHEVRLRFNLMGITCE